MLCNAIEYLSNKAKQENANPSSSTFVSHLTPQQHATVVGLVGKRCTVKGEINGQKVDVRWETGAQVSLICVLCCTNTKMISFALLLMGHAL